MVFPLPGGFPLPEMVLFLPVEVFSFPVWVFFLPGVFFVPHQVFLLPLLILLCWYSAKF